MAAKVEFRYDELFPRVGFIVTTLETDNRGVVRFYNKRGTAEQWIKVGKEARAGGHPMEGAQGAMKEISD